MMNIYEKKQSIAIISYHFGEIESSRPLLISECLKNNSDIQDVHVFCANFNHVTKTPTSRTSGSITEISVYKYKNNISLGRIYSYLEFSYRILFRFNELKRYTILYFCVPSYESCLIAFFYKTFTRKKNIIDIVDLWPEAIPINSKAKYNIKKALLLFIKPIRKLFLKAIADVLITQSNYFKNIISIPSKTFCLPMTYPHKHHDYIKNTDSISQTLSILLIGSINSITDIESLLKILHYLSKFKRTHLTVIGDGNRLEYLKAKVSELEVTHTFYGFCYDLEIKKKEFSKAHFGYNAYIATTEVSVSYRAMEYLSYGLPLINACKGDLNEIVRTESCGFNFDENTIPELCRLLLAQTPTTLAELNINASKAFDKNFSYENFKNTLSEILKKV